MLGCDSPLPAGKEHVIVLDSGEEIRMDTCPRKSANQALDYLKAYSWAKEGRLQFLYREDELPAFVAQAIDMVGVEVNQHYINKDK